MYFNWFQEKTRDVNIFHDMVITVEMAYGFHMNLLATVNYNCRLVHTYLGDWFLRKNMHKILNVCTENFSTILKFNSDARFIDSPEYSNQL